MFKFGASAPTLQLSAIFAFLPGVFVHLFIGYFDTILVSTLLFIVVIIVALLTPNYTPLFIKDREAVIAMLFIAPIIEKEEH